MKEEARFLVLSDLHLAGVLKRDDIKGSGITGISNPSKVDATTDLLDGISRHLRNNKIDLDAVIFAGDAQDKGSAGSHQAALDAIISAFGLLGIDESKIISTPGNHDVLKGSAPGSIERYEAFASVWRDRGCVVPWLDGVDEDVPKTTDRYRLVSQDGLWAIYTVNTSNWSQVRANVPDNLKTVWSDLPKAYAGGNGILEEQVRSALEKLLDYDIAQVSDTQMKVFRRTVAETPKPENKRQVRLAVMHHHLRAPSLRLEVKPYEALINLEHVRTLLQESDVGAVVHGHKHEHAFRYEYVETEDPEQPHRMAVLSAGTFQDGKEEDAALLVTLKGLPHLPEISVERIALPRSGLDLTLKPAETLAVSQHKKSIHAPIVIEGNDLDELYARAARQTRAHQGEILVVHYNPPEDGGANLRLPAGYPRPNNVTEEEIQTWLDDLVTWWQLARSRRDNEFPYPHGARLRLFGGKLNQINRIVSILKKEASSRAFAVLVDPLRDFSQTGENEAFPSFTLMQVRRRPIAFGEFAIDVLGFYRAQEFSQWWPVNVAELRILQSEIAIDLNAKPGMITTITTDARFKPQGPGQVSVPVFDRWLDQSPEKLFMLALALIGDHRNKPGQTLLLKEWVRSLEDIQAAATESNIDGILIPADGLDMLLTYLEMIDTSDEHAPLIRAIRNLQLVNKSFVSSDKRKTERSRWSEAIERLIPEIIALSPNE